LHGKAVRKENCVKPLNYFKSLIRQIQKDKAAYIVYLVLNSMVAAVFVRTLMQRNYESSFICILAFFLFLIPPFVETTFGLRLPNALEIIAFVFVFAAEILGEIEAFYVKVPIWDTLLHTVNGFIFAAFGFCLVEMLNRSRRTKFDMSPFFCATVAFCLSMTIGVLWEFFEFGMDFFFHTDMQKDFFVDAVYSVSFAEPGSNTAVPIEEIVSTTLITASGESITLSGYLDIGIIDTMKDLFVNFIGAAVFSVIGFFHVRHEGKSKFARQFIPEVLTNEEQSDSTKAK
jgi:hypothetical protein